MATKAERFRYRIERSGPKKAKTPWHPEPGPHLDEPNYSVRAGRKATVAMEASSNERPSRKSTRKSANRVKADAPIRLAKTIMQLLTGRRT